MSDRPSLQLEGEYYLRRSGTWVGASSHIGVPVKVASMLDDLARSDHSFWERCLRQDWEDAPPERRSLKVDPDGKIRMNAIPKGKPSSRATTKSRKGPERLLTRFDGDGSIVLTCDFESAWRRTKSSWRVGESTRVDLKGGCSLRLTAAIVEIRWNRWQRRYFGDWPLLSGRKLDVDGLIPQFSGVERRLGESFLKLHQRKCEWSFPLFTRKGWLNSALPWRPTSGCWLLRYAACVYEDAIAIRAFSGTVQRAFHVQLRAVLREPPKPELNPVVERDLPFASAGLPSHGKRR